MTPVREVFDAIVVGGGLAGLVAAVELHEGGAAVRVVEAAAVAGGRIRTLRDDTRGAAVADLGPTWVWPPFQPVVVRWLDRLGVATFPQYERGDALLDGWGAQVQRSPVPVQSGITRIVGGPGALIEALLARLPEDALRLSAPVHRVGPASGEMGSVHGELIVTLANGDRQRASRVVLATPLRVAAEQITFDGIPSGELATLRSALLAAPTWMSTQAKVVVTYPEPFWRAAGLSGRIASRLGPLVEVHDHTPHDEAVGALFGFVGVAPDVRGRAPEQLRTAIIAQLVRCLGEDARMPLTLHMQDWATEPYICARADLAAPPAHPDVGPALLRAPLFGGRLVLAVSEASAVSPGLIEGALWAGEASGRAMLET